MKVKTLYQLEDGTLIKVGDLVKITTNKDYDSQIEWVGKIESIYEYDGIVLDNTSCWEIGWEYIKSISVIEE